MLYKFLMEFQETYIYQRKGILPMIIGGLVGSVATGLMNRSNQSAAQSSSAAHDEHMFGLQSQHQRDMFGLQQGHDIDMFNRQVEANRFNAQSGYQWATQDMRKAGLNPMLAFMQGGAQAASAGQGAGSAQAGASGSSAGRIGPHGFEPLQLAEVMLRDKELKQNQQLINAQSANQLSEARARDEMLPHEKEYKTATSQQAQQQISNLKTEIGLITSQIEESQERIKVLQQEVRESKTREDRERATTNLQKAQGDLARQQSEHERIKGRLSELGIPKKELEAIGYGVAVEAAKGALKGVTRVDTASRVPAGMINRRTRTNR